jgi:3-oxoacyl-[acyl-carrier protein] reductase
MTNLTGKTALVTGASRGIGRATAIALAKAGARVLVHYSNAEQAADSVVAAIRAAGGQADKSLPICAMRTDRMNWRSARAH